ncbi:MAG TPA: hypothetical protein VIY48_16115 [Candidatus Paceibacterota bacterium]
MSNPYAADWNTSTLFATAGFIRLPSGKLFQAYHVSSTVQTDSLDAVRFTMGLIISHAMYEGRSCTEPQALAAAFSVPDGSPIEMAELNVGPLPSEEIHNKIMAWKSKEVKGPTKWSREMWKTYRG